MNLKVPKTLTRSLLALALVGLVLQSSGDISFANGLSTPLAGASWGSLANSLAVQAQELRFDTIAYIGIGGNLYLVGLDGTGQRQLTTDGGYSEPACLQDGTRVAFAHFSVADSEVGILDPESLEQTILVNTGSPVLYLTNPRWSPDQSILYYQENLGARGVRAIRRLYVSDGRIDNTLSLSSYGFDIAPSDGAIVYLVVFNAGAATGTGLMLANSDGLEMLS